MKLFMVYLGGTAPGANIEVHDIRFVVGDSIKDTYPQLRQQWFGEAKGLHLDSYLEVHDIDGYHITLVAEPVQQAQKLYFVNFGGYYPAQMAEQHEFMLCVASSAAEAKKRAKAALLIKAQSPHKDDLLELDDLIQLDQLQGYYIELQPSGANQAQQPDWFGYEVIG
ncbi:DUF1543 domain-containing protein [Rheinheimera sp. UJ63]|uniref:DUF1543 domain-containing protein n=1 Tax=Rheinheimera sp. UJ63 TaxID=2910157 RepID=UPI001F1D125C|nr:DUF1543 domain-containing protein [Rheinheimera sp. UJ63]MCF4010230.1 DUF1543 domain-containing protein [Rheinheimera sp. UJ63]